ncbi:hypothetical protein OK016_02475 [Vibrio chagasii]|nr:hypothetical protein [Vibrio chagasii]
MSLSILVLYQQGLSQAVYVANNTYITGFDAGGVVPPLELSPFFGDARTEMLRSIGVSQQVLLSFRYRFFVDIWILISFKAHVLMIYKSLQIFTSSANYPDATCQEDNEILMAKHCTKAQWIG